MTLKWGDPIECNGVRPDWLRDDESAEIENSPREWLEWSGCVWHSRVTAIRLPADHPAYVALARGFHPWGGGESAPDDWDGGECLARGGSLLQLQPSSWKHPWFGGEGHNPYDVIGYRKRNTRFDQPHLARIEVDGSAPVEGVFIKQLSRDEVLELWHKESTVAYSLATPMAERVVSLMRGLGLVRRDETLAERFTRETGHAVTEAVQAALNWKGE